MHGREPGSTFSTSKPVADMTDENSGAGRKAALWPPDTLEVTLSADAQMAES